MKTRFIIICACVASIVALFSCTKEKNNLIDNPNDVIVNEGIPFEITVSSDETKTTIADKTTSWEATDNINLFHAEAGNTSSFTNDGQFSASAAGSSVAFTGTLAAELTADYYDWYAIYPYSSYNTTPKNSGSSGYVTIGSAASSSQIQTGNSNMNHIAGANYPIAGKVTGVAKETKPAITMTPLTSIVAVEVTNETTSAINVSEIAFTGTEANGIVGTYYIDFTGADVVFTKSSDTYVSNTARLTISAGEEIAAGEKATFYLAIKPFTAHTGESITLSVTTTQKGLQEKVSSSLTDNFSFLAGKIHKLTFSYTKTALDYDVLNYTWTGISGTGYSAWSDKNGSFSSAVYAGYSGGQNSAIQLKSNDNISGIVTTTSGGLLKNISLDWNSNTADGRIVSVYGRQTPYTSADDLYTASTRGLLIASIPKGTTSITIPAGNNYPYIGIRSSSGALYLDNVRVTWKTDTRASLTAPSFSVAAGEVAPSTSLTITSAEGGSIYYTLDGTIPSEASTPYTDALTIDDNVTVKAIAVSNDYKASAVSSATYTVPTCATPTFDHAEGDIASGTDVVISCTTDNAVIYYTTDGTDPTGESAHGTAGNDVTVANITVATTIKAFAKKAGCKDSAIATAAYTISGVATPLSAPSSVTFHPNPTIFTATWANDANAAGYSWYISQASSAAGIDLENDPHGTFSVSSLDGTGASLNEGTWTLTKSQSLTIGTTYYFYVMANGNGATYSNSNYAAPINCVVPLVISVSDITTTGSYSGTEVGFTENSKAFGYIACMKNSANSPSDWAKQQVIQLRKSSSGAGSIYNKDALGSQIKNIRVYLVGSSNFSVKYGTSTDVNAGSISRPTTPTGTQQVIYNVNSGGTASATLNYYDFNIASHNASHFQILNGGSANYIYKIEITY